MMKRWGLPFAVLVAGLVAATYSQMGSAKRSGFPAPDFSLPDLGGRVHRLSSLHGKVVFLNVWATWCPPCREEMPSMETLYQRLKDQDFIMLAVSQDENGKSAVEPFVEQMKLTFPVLIDTSGLVSRRYGVTGYPETFVIDRDGKVVEHIIGPEDWASDASYRYFEKLLRAGESAERAQVNPARAGS